MKKKLKNIKGILSDIDGTLYFKGSPISGAIETVSKLRRKGIKLLFFTNTDSKTPKSIYKNLLEYGFTVKEDELFTPIIAVKKFLSVHRKKKIFLVSTREIEDEFNEFSIIQDDEIPDYVIISDFRDNWDVFRLNRAFKYLLKGAKLFGTQGNRYFLDLKGEPVIDTGSFVKMLADVANVPYKIFGKPSIEFFNQALNKLSLTTSDCIVVGDDLESDIQGANNIGIKSILVKTGKGIHYEPSKKKIKPFLIIDSFKSLLDYL
ncbi:MAG: HAD-IIA family hydrolase [Promethearchaeota archaeon]|jgi:HAD superfamily hydrolase (TIGR01458 family)